ncbi:MAG: DNA methyltransferase [Gammaproteobacteria bacterium]|nr:DNA methyltransferase [Gammaproteobacteria bacterium]MDE0251873.1 DNA methyltransferase [Gammaproteobacteria bacterium]MDE0403118.1 DNA methyltransferase [Gammaproteobacteria bacterium]
MGKPNWKNRTLFHGDNLKFMRAMNSESVDLIATDPPFNKGKDFHATPESLSAGAKFQDRWSWEDDVHEEWIDQLEDDWANVWEVINGARNSWGDDMGAYLCYMGVRLIEMHRLLKPTGSIYLHCDPTASHYLKMLMDSIFGRKNFRNEIVWHYSNASRGKKMLAKSHDVIFWYSKSSVYTFNRDSILVPFSSGMTEWRYTKGGQAGKPMPKGKTPDDMISMPSLNTMDKERYGYPTQKPLALYERFVQTSSNGGDIVLDPFCGCATTLVACERMHPKRQWVGIDIWEKSNEAAIKRLESEGLIAPKYTNKTPEMRQQYLWADEFHFIKRVPKRTDEGEESTVTYLETLEKFKKEAWERLSRKSMTAHLKIAQAQDGWVICGGCGRELEIEFMELDHINPRAGRGSNDITNRILLCSHCNRKKKHEFTLVGLVKLNQKDGWMYDLQTATNAQTRATNYAEKIKRGLISLKDGID